MTRHRDISGQTFGLLTALERVGGPAMKGGKVRWRCRCACGAEVEAQSDRLVCGRKVYCDRKRHMDLTLPQHAHPVEYRVWCSMKSRCSDPDRRNYGARGISVCQRWQDSFDAFFADMGPRPDDRPTIERLDVNGDYEPGNCVWATWQTQSANRRDTVWVEWKGERRKFVELMRELGADERKVRSRLKIGWALDRAISRPVHKPVPKPPAPRPPSKRGPAMRLLAQGYSVREVVRLTGAHQSTVYLARELLNEGRPIPPD